MLPRIFVLFLLFQALSAPLDAAVDLVTLPTRETTQLTIYNSEDITMVREHRLLTVKVGINRIQFSWANTLIDPTSIEFRILDKQDKVDLVDTTFPAGRNDALQWNIKSQVADKIAVEIRYFTSGITWAADYVGIANEDETKINLTGYVRVTNGSGEQYHNAETRLVVGNINLVEKIADLARRPPPGKWRDMDEGKRKQVELYFDQAAKDGENKAGEFAEWHIGIAGQVPLETKKQVIKQGLSEYFLFTIEGREDIKDKEPKRLVALKALEVPLESIYKLSDRTGIMMPVWTPSSKPGLITEVYRGDVSVISLGTNNGILKGQQLVVCDPENDKYLATIETVKVTPDRAVCRGVWQSFPSIQKGDIVLVSFPPRAAIADGEHFTKFYRFKNVKLLDEHGKEKKLSCMENLGLSPLPNGTVRLFSERRIGVFAYVGGTETKYVPIGDRVEVNVGPGKDITLQRRVKDQKIGNVIARQYKRRLDDKFVLYYDLVDYDETFFYEEELVSGKPAKIEVERQFDANVVLWGSEEQPKSWTSNEAGAYVDLHTVGHVERVDQQHVKYFLDLKPGKKQTVAYSVTYKRRKVGPEINTEKKREPL